MNTNRFRRPALGVICIVIATCVPLCAHASLRDAPKDPALRKELARRVKEDQDARNAWIMWSQAQGVNSGPFKEKPPVIARLQRIDAANRAWLKKIVERRGWPGKSLVGEDGAQNAWLLVQHADEDKAFQNRCLKLMEGAAAKGEVRKDNVAYLTDRVLKAYGKPQRYGTQTKIVGGDVQLDPVEDEANLDKRRASVGMPPISEYLKLVREMYLGKKP